MKTKEAVRMVNDHGSYPVATVDLGAPMLQVEQSRITLELATGDVVRISFESARDENLVRVSARIVSETRGTPVGLERR